MGHQWHPADIHALIRKKGGTFTSIAKEYNLQRSTPRHALYRPCYAGEQAVAAFLGMKPRELWPDRYDDDGLPLHPRIRKKLLSVSKKTDPRQNAELV